MSTRLVYIVIATLPTPELEGEYVAWLEDGHVDAVISAGAHSAMIVRLDSPTPDAAVGAPHPRTPGVRRVMTQYIFPTREIYDRYVQKHAPALRADGLKRFGPDTGVTFERLLGDIA